MMKTVLVVDDERDLRDLVAHHLSGAGYRVLQAVRGVEGIAPATASIPAPFLTARGEETDRVVGFELGERKVVLAQRGIRLDPDRHEAAVNGERVELTPLEFRLLSYLMSRPGRVLRREQLLENVWGNGVFVTERTADTHVERLRATLGIRAERIETVRGVGYRFRD
jgi:two-component system, OmpR family, phosphate regulon response regulator PhoB